MKEVKGKPGLPRARFGVSPHGEIVLEKQSEKPRGIGPETRLCSGHLKD